jgi:transcriptional regulator with XRE-family HTH domain
LISYHGCVADLQRTTAGALLVLARQDRDISQRELAALAGVAQSEIAKIESGKREPSIPTLQRILAGARLELRLRLAPIDSHDAALAARHDRRSPEDQKALDARHQKNLAQFASNATER